MPAEETINEILYRHTEHNTHATSYDWKAILQYDVQRFIVVDMNKTLTVNGVQDESHDFAAAGMAGLLAARPSRPYTDDLTTDRRVYSCACQP